MLERAGAYWAKPQIKKTVYRNDIDGLRALAVLSVIGFHAFPGWVPGGFVGVDIFFVISGYLISGHIFNSLEAGNFSIVTFYGKRVRRIFPAMILVLAACLIFGWLALLPDEFLQLGKHTAAGSGFVANLVFWSEAGYFNNTAATKPMLHLWSLGVEEQFYIIWPILAWAAWTFRWKLLPTMILLAGFSFALNTTYYISNPDLDFYSPMTRFWEIIAGASLAQMEREGNGSIPSLTRVLSLSGILCIGIAIYATTEFQFPGWMVALPVLGAFLFIGAGPAAVGNRIVGLKPFVAIGKISYSMYLWHWPLLSFAHIIYGGNAPRSVRVAAVLATVVLAAVSFWLIEKPMRTGGNLPLKAYGSVVAMALVGLAGIYVAHGVGLPNRSSIKAMNAVANQFTGPLWAYTQNDTCMKRYPFKEAEGYGWWFCVANKNAPPTVLLLGTSFANHLYPGLVSVLPGQNILSIGDCPPVSVDPSNDPPQGPAPCSGARGYNQQRFIDTILAKEKSVKFVIMDGIEPGSPENWVSRIKRRVDEMEALGAQVVIFNPHLKPTYDIKACFARPFKPPQISCEFDLSEREKLNGEFSPLVELIKKSNPKVKFFDQNDLFCKESNCSYIRDGLPLFRDEYHHLSIYGSNQLGKLFAQWAETNLPQILAH